jgi:MOSC domain-containing protein YiiM
MSGRLIGIARATEVGAPMEQLARAAISIEAGVEGDARGRKPGRQVTVLFREGWEDACHDAGSDPLPWTTRRANLYVEDMEPLSALGLRLKVGDVVLEVADETKPCALMERARPGLRMAMKPDWRGGVCCNVITGGLIRLGDIASPVPLEG